MAPEKSLQDQIDARVAERNDVVSLTREFTDLCAKRQVLRSRANSVAGGRLARLGYGVYERAARSPPSGKPMLAANQGFEGAARQALTKLGLAWEPGQWEQACNDGRSTQVPANAVVRVKGRFAGRLSYRCKPHLLDR